jgi:hypothetical protein
MNVQKDSKFLQGGPKKTAHPEKILFEKYSFDLKLVINKMNQQLLHVKL